MTEVSPQPAAHVRLGLHPHRARITCDVVTLSPLHIGSGVFDDTVMPPHTDDTTGQMVRPALARCLRGDGDGDRFFLPGTAIKNLLRRHTATGHCDELYGTVKNDGSGAMGAVLCWGGLCAKTGPVEDAPYAACLKNGGFAAARTAIDDATGAAANNRLFFQEMVPPGSRFPIELLVVADTAEALRTRTARLLGVLKGLGDGAAIGKGQADGQGRIAIPWDTVTWEVRRLDRTGAFAAMDDTITPDEDAAAAPFAAARTWTLDLTCEGPFMVVDSSYEAPGNGEGPQLRTQTLNGMPLVPGSSIMGALHSRMEWIEACNGHEPDDPDAVYSTETAPARVQRLCGMTGFRGLLQARSVVVTAASALPWDVTSVKIDRFSGGPFDSGLFCSRTYTGTSITVTLVLENRGTDAAQYGEDAAFVEEVLADLADEGLMLGHGTNKGFGWFTVTVREEKSSQGGS